MNTASKESREHGELVAISTSILVTDGLLTLRSHSSPKFHCAKAAFIWHVRKLELLKPASRVRIKTYSKPKQVLIYAAKEKRSIRGEVQTKI